MANKMFVIPEYQRKSTWIPADKSLLIESIFLGLPITFLFCERDDGTTEIVKPSTSLHGPAEMSFSLLFIPLLCPERLKLPVNEDYVTIIIQFYFFGLTLCLL